MDAQHRNHQPHRHQPQHPASLPNGWLLIDCYDGSTSTVLRFARSDQPTRHRVTVIGRTYEDALSLGIRRMQLSDEMEHQRSRFGQ